MNTVWWVSCEKFTIWVETDEERRIVDIAPVARRFKGQSFDNLLRWFAGFGGLKYEQINKRSSNSVEAASC